MVAGLYQKLNIIRMTVTDDDDVGGANVTGTVIYSHVDARIQSTKPTQALLEQGLETDKLFVAVIRPGGMDIRERDEVQVVHPTRDPYYNDRFRIRGVQHSSHHPGERRDYMMLTLSRSEEAHANQ